MFQSEGSPCIVQSDNGKEFRNSLITDLSVEWGFTLSHSRPRNPKCQGQVERVNQTICRFLAKELHNQPKIWLNIIDSIVLKYNTSWHRAINRSPFEAFRRRRYKKLTISSCLDEVENSSSLTEQSDSEDESDLFNIDLYNSQADQEVKFENEEYLRRSNISKQVHLRKNEINVGDYVLFGVDFDNNTATRKEKLGGFYDTNEYKVIDQLTRDEFIIENELSSKKVKRSQIVK